MADSSKTEKPSAKRLEKARLEGQFVVSKEMITAAQFFVFVAMLGSWFPGWMAGMNCTAEAPVPMTATRLPARSKSWSHRAEWNVVPANRSTPGNVGMTGSASAPVAMTTWLAVR